MALMPSPDSLISVAASERLLKVAADSIRAGLHGGSALNPDPAAYPPELCRQAASFVTLHLRKELRGCVGSLEAQAPLVVNVAENAHRAAFADPRFPPLSARELDGLDIHISVLSPLEPIDVLDEADLLRKLRPKVDGLLLREGRRQATFLPAVWESLPDPAVFLLQLKLKAGLPVDHWSDALAFWRYSVDEIP